MNVESGRHPALDGNRLNEMDTSKNTMVWTMRCHRKTEYLGVNMEKLTTKQELKFLVMPNIQ